MAVAVAQDPGKSPSGYHGFDSGTGIGYHGFNSGTGILRPSIF